MAGKGRQTGCRGDVEAAKKDQNPIGQHGTSQASFSSNAGTYHIAEQDSNSQSSAAN